MKKKDDKWNIIEKITTSNDYTKKIPIFWNYFLYRWWKKYLEDNLEKIWENKESLNIEEVINWTKELTNEILDPINWNQVKSLRELEDLLVEKYWAWKVHKYIDKNWKEYNIRFSTSFNIKWTTILRNDGNINIDWWITPKATHNLSNQDFIWIDALWWSSIPAAPTGWYNKKQKWTNEWPHQWFWFLWKIPKLRPMHNDFDKNLYEEIMNLPIKVAFKWFAYESNSDEIVIMPTFEIKWKELEEKIKQFSQKIPEWKQAIPTSKKYLSDL